MEGLHDHAALGRQLRLCAAPKAHARAPACDSHSACAALLALTDIVEYFDGKLGRPKGGFDLRTVVRLGPSSDGTAPPTAIAKWAEAEPTSIEYISCQAQGW